jgi:hypothetical protein
MKSRIESLPKDGFNIDEAMWGKGAEERVQFFLATEYDERTMPRLAAADIRGREGVWLLGWENEGTDFPPLLVYLFGQAYADERMRLLQLRMPGREEGRFGRGRQR